MGERSMYEKEVDAGDIGAQWSMAREIFKDGNRPMVSVQAGYMKDGQPIAAMQLNVVNRLVAEGARQFKDHDDVMMKLLGVR